MTQASIFVIRAWDNSYLKASSRSYGSQAGVCRIWSEDIRQALVFSSWEEAKSVLDSERLTDSIIHEIDPENEA